MEETMGNLQRIFYYHLAHAILSLVFPYINLVASLAYLYWRRRDPLKALSADALAVASAEVTVLYAGICLATGMLWGKPAWGIWWTWDARLTTELILWLLYVSYLLLRRFSPTGQTGVLSAVLAVFAAVDVPIVFMSIRWWRTQHPAPVFGPDGGGIDPAMVSRGPLEPRRLGHVGTLPHRPPLCSRTPSPARRAGGCPPRPRGLPRDPSITEPDRMTWHDLLRLLHHGPSPSCLRLRRSHRRSARLRRLDRPQLVPHRRPLITALHHAILRHLHSGRYSDAEAEESLYSVGFHGRPRPPSSLKKSTKLQKK